MSEKIESKAKTTLEIIKTPKEPDADKKWVPLEEAQKAIDERVIGIHNDWFEEKTKREKLEKVIEGYEKALQKITAIAEEDENKIAKANEILGGHCSGYYHCHNGSYDELKEILEAKQS